MAKAYYPDGRSKHKVLIEHMCDEIPGLQSTGFWPSVKNLLDELDIEFKRLPFNPDAFRVDRENTTLEIHEAVITHSPRDDALRAMGSLWFDFDCAHWDVKLFIHRLDTTTPAEVELAFWYFDWLRECVEDALPTRLTTNATEEGARNG